MATEVTIGGEGALFVGEDKTLRLELLDSGGVPVDMATWPAGAVKFDVRARDHAADPALLLKTATVSGTYSATRALNTQRAAVTLTDTEMGTLSGKTYRHSWKRTDDGSETILAYGDFVVERATQI